MIPVASMMLVAAGMVLSQGGRPDPAPRGTPPAAPRQAPVPRGTPASAPASAPAAEPVFSGPQAGEKVPSLRVTDLTGGRADREFDPTREASSEPTLYFFFQTPSRIVANAIVEIDAITRQAHEHGLRSYFIGLMPDKLEGDQRLRDVWTSLKPATPATLADGGVEGPGNWGLNKQCAVTIVIAKDGKVVRNIAALAPGEPDFDAVRDALTTLLGKRIDARRQQTGGRGMSGGGRGMDGGGGMSGGGGRAPAASQPAPRGPRGG
ncbi:MAG TPA: hypothetical protein VKE69_04420 [Planctomycetota bacterium]|nr:hypothetical protein [Planctomycetota bacterium]